MAGLLAAADFADELRSSRGGAPAGLGATGNAV